MSDCNLIDSYVSKLPQLVETLQEKQKSQSEKLEVVKKHFNENQATFNKLTEEKNNLQKDIVYIQQQTLSLSKDIKNNMAIQSQILKLVNKLSDLKKGKQFNLDFVNMSFHRQLMKDFLSNTQTGTTLHYYTEKKLELEKRLEIVKNQLSNNFSTEVNDNIRDNICLDFTKFDSSKAYLTKLKSDVDDKIKKKESLLAEVKALEHNILLARKRVAAQKLHFRRRQLQQNFNYK